MLLTRPPLTIRKPPVRLACVKHSASVHSEPGSNSQVHLRAGIKGPNHADANQQGSVHHSRCKMPLSHHQTSPSPRDSTGRQGRKHLLASKRQMRLSKIWSHQHQPTGDAPHLCKGKKNWCPGAQRTGSAARRRFNPLDRRLHPKASPTCPERATAPLQGTRLSARRHQYQEPLSERPGEYIRLAADT